MGCLAKINQLVFLSLKLTMKNTLTLGFGRQPENTSEILPKYALRTKTQPSSLFDCGDSCEEDLKFSFF